MPSRATGEWHPGWPAIQHVGEEITNAADASQSDMSLYDQVTSNLQPTSGAAEAWAASEWVCIALCLLLSDSLSCCEGCGGRARDACTASSLRRFFP